MEKTELPAPQQMLVDQIRDAARRLGGVSFVESDTGLRAWIQQHFPGWKQSELFPYFIPLDAVTFAPPPYADAPGHVLWLHAVEHVLEFNLYHEHDELREKGYFIIGSDRGGGLVTINTNSDSGLNVALVDAGEYACWGLTGRNTIHTGRRVDEFLGWVFDDPEGFVDVWHHHYDNYPEP
jgi:hypothetical protein